MTKVTIYQFGVYDVMNDAAQKSRRWGTLDSNATQAALRAGYSVKTASFQGERLLRHVEVAEAVAAGRQDQVEKLEHRRPGEAMEETATEDDASAAPGRVSNHHATVADQRGENPSGLSERRVNQAPSGVSLSRMCVSPATCHTPSHCGTSGDCSLTLAPKATLGV